MNVLIRNCLPPSGSCLKYTRLSYNRNRLEYNRALSNFAQTQQQSKVAKDVILFKYENPKYFKYLNLFSVVQFMLWAVVGKVSVSSMKNIPVKEESITEDMPWWKKINLGEGKYKHTLAFICYFFGTATLGFAWIYTLRTVRYLILNKGGQKISLVTYTPFGENRIYTVPLKMVSCQHSRASVSSTLPIKVQGRKFQYILDMRGEFKNGPLFDVTAGMMRHQN